MNRRSASRNLTTFVLVLFLAGVAAPAVALPAGPPVPGGAAWDVGGFLGWLHSVAAGLFESGGETSDSGIPGATYGQARMVVDPDGNSNDLTAESSSHGLEEESPAREATPTPQ